MGRLRDGYENPLFQHYSSEIVDLYGTDEVILYRFDEALSDSVADPLWDEYAPAPKYRAFKIKGFRFDISRDGSTNSPHGKNTEIDVTSTISRNHLDHAGVPTDVDGRMVREGDVLLFHERGDTFYYDIIGTNRKGHVNNTDSWTYVECTMKRREKFTPERKLP